MGLRIGYTEHNYQQSRNIIGQVPDCEYVLLRDAWSAIRRLTDLVGVPPKLRSSSWISDARFKFKDYDFNRVDLVHTYNSVSYGRRPWVCTFETLVPRFRSALGYRLADPTRVREDSDVLRAIRLLAGNSCKKLLAHSQNAVGMQRELLDLFPEYSDEIMTKLVVVGVPQPLYPSANKTGSPSDYRSGSRRRDIRFMMVGHAFFRKGGREILGVLDHLRTSEGYPVTLTIVSRLGSDAYATRTGPADVAWAERFIADRKDWVTHHESLPNPEVHELMESCDVGLLPSYAETYGFAVLEFQSHGRPVITTDVRAFPEINSDECGWLIPVPKRPNGEAVYNEPGGRTRISAAIRNGLTAAIAEIVEKPSIAAVRGERALERIRTQHDPAVFSRQLADIYSDALADRTP